MAPSRSSKVAMGSSNEPVGELGGELVAFASGALGSDADADDGSDGLSSGADDEERTSGAA